MQSLDAVHEPTVTAARTLETGRSRSSMHQEMHVKDASEACASPAADISDDGGSI